MTWAIIFMIVILKIPIVYLCAVVYYAIKAEPRPLDGAGTLATVDEPEPRRGWQRRLRPRRPRSGPHDSPLRRPRVRAGAARARAERRRS